MVRTDVNAPLLKSKREGQCSAKKKKREDSETAIAKVTQNLVPLTLNFSTVLLDFYDPFRWQ